MVEAQEVHSLAPCAQLHDPGLGLFRRNPSSASSTVNRANAATACPFDRHVTKASSAYADWRIMPTVA